MHRVLIFLVFLSVFCGNLSYAQQADMRLFQNVCEGIYWQSYGFSLVQKLPGITYAIEPIEDKYWIIYPKNADEKVLAEFKKLSHNKQVEAIGKQIEFPPDDSFRLVFPIRTDTVLMVDTVNFFRRELTYAYKGHFFKILMRRTPDSKDCTFYLHKNVSIDEHGVILGFFLLKKYYFSFCASSADSKIYKSRFYVWSKWEY